MLRLKGELLLMRDGRATHLQAFWFDTRLVAAAA